MSDDKAGGERREDCGRPVTRTDDDYPNDALCFQTDSAGNYLLSNCQEFTITRLKAELAERTGQMEEARRECEAWRALASDMPKSRRCPDCGGIDPFHRCQEWAREALASARLDGETHCLPATDPPKSR